ncbi:MAG: hypothetical protein RLZZ32_72 [Cyanobacteriota bacterium]|jgi:hypothetical protein
MIAYLLAAALLVPVNIWAAITPHLHSDTSMRILHGSSSLVLVPVLITLWRSRRSLQQNLAVFYAVFLVVMVVVNVWITANGMGIKLGWLDHLFLSLAASSVVSFYFCSPIGSSLPSESQPSASS